MTRLRYLLSALALLFLSSPARAEFMMSEMIIDFGPSAPRQHDVELSSQSKDTQYIVTETYTVEHASEPNEKRTLVNDPQQSGLLVTPKKMVLPANARKSMRFLLLKPQTDSDQIYRVVVKPVTQDVENKDQRMALKVLVGYEALVVVRPKDAKIDLVAERKGNSLTIVNKGNTNAYLQSGQQCNATGGECKDLAVARIYAGQTWTTTLPHMNGTATYRVWDGTTAEDKSF